MDSGTLPQHIANRLSIGVMFTFVGPFFGSLATLLFLFVAALFAPGSNWFAFLPFVVIIFAMGYMFGIGPAMLCGIAYAIVPGPLQRLLLAPIFGAAAVWLFYEIVGSTGGSFGAEMSNNIMMLFAGAVAALTCAWIAKRSGWTPNHGQSPQPAV